jgi:hypothetical protein
MAFRVGFGRGVGGACQRVHSETWQDRGVDDASSEPTPPLYTLGADLAWVPEPPRRRPWRRSLRIAVLTALVIAAAGVLLGVLWHLAAPTVPVIDAGQNGIVVNDPSPEEYIASDGWFTIFGFAFGLIAAVVAWLVVRNNHGPGLLLGVSVGALAAAPVAWQVGRQFGLTAYERWRDTAATGATYHAPPDLHAHGALLVPGFAAVIVMTLLAGWSNDPDLEKPGAMPGYGHDLAHGPAGRYPSGQPVSQLGMDPNGYSGDPDSSGAGGPYSSDSPGRYSAGPGQHN